MAITEAVAKVGEAVKSLFDYVKETKEHQSETQVIKEFKRLKKATNIAEQIFYVTDCYIPYFSEDDKKKYEKLRLKFDKKD